jgi:tetratricopeptide (TPR) repeat protein
VPSRLTVVNDSGGAGGASPQRVVAPLVTAATLGAAVVAAVVSGAYEYRAERPAREIAAEALRSALERGSADEQVRLAATELRRRIERRPLDARTRVAYAGLLHGLSRGLDDTAAAAFHARRAAELAPVTVPVVRAATVVLARSLRWREAAGYTREMFRYDPRAAARLLATLEPFLPPDAFDATLAGAPGAWLAWIDRLRLDGREAEAHRRLEDALRRWPDEGPFVERAAAAALRDGDEARLEELFATPRDIPETPANARVLAYRGHAQALAGEPTAARADLERALALDGGDPRLLIVAGDAYLALGEEERAASLWGRARFTTEPGSRAVRLRAMVRLARLEDRRGRAGNALRLWRAIESADPQNGEARRRVRELTGG